MIFGSDAAGSVAAVGADIKKFRTTRGYQADKTRQPEDDCPASLSFEHDCGGFGAKQNWTYSWHCYSSPRLRTCDRSLKSH